MGLAWAFKIRSQAKSFGLTKALAWPGLAFQGLAWLGLGLEAKPSTSLVVLGVGCCGRVELRDVSADDGISESVSGGICWRSWSGKRVSNISIAKYRKRLCREEEETREYQMNS